MAFYVKAGVYRGRVCLVDDVNAKREFRGGGVLAFLFFCNAFL